MKKLFTLILVAGLFLGANAQDIINKYGSGGKFLINNSNDVTEFELRETIFNDAELVIGKNTVNIGNEDVWMLNVQSKAIGPFVSLAGLENAIGGSQLWFQKARFADPSLLPPLAGDEVGKIIFSGYQGTTFHSVAAITSNIVAPGTSQSSADLKFWTSTVDAGMQVRMTIKDDGDVVVENGGLVIASGDLDMVGNLASTGTARFGDLGSAGGGQGDAYVIADDNGNLSRGAAVPPNMPLISQLQKENKELRDRLEKLEAIVEELNK